MIKVNVLESVSHDRYHLHKGDTVQLPNGVAEILKKSGFVEYDSSDLIGEPEGDAKMDSEEIANKMDAEPVKNKAIKTPKAD